ncbi:MAG: CBS domain-containing protein [Myxococcota bacterium]
MGELNVDELSGAEQERLFMKRLLDDVRALEAMLDGGMIESGVRRIGAEQEMFLIHQDGGPAPMAMDLLDGLNDEAFTTELALFNLEANMKPFHLAGQCLRRLEREIVRLVDKVRTLAREKDGDVVLCGILPTLRLEDLTLDNMTPKSRYFALNKTMQRLRGGGFQTLIKGLDELDIEHDNILLEACNTSFQLHFQVGAREFAKLYNLAQVVTGPVLAAAVNSPLLLKHRLWHETRIALFQQSVDIRSTTLKKRGRRTRVSFGERWVDDSVIEIFREDIARLRLLIATDVDEDSLAMVQAGKPPELHALRLYNGTVYRWNRPCYGIHGGKAHLRIENRVLPAGPTAIDEVANAAFYFGLMSRMHQEYGPVRDVMDFDETKENFITAARHGLDATFKWRNGETVKARDLVLNELLPIARAGLEAKRVDTEDVDRYLGVIEERVRSNATGSSWVLRSWGPMSEHGLRKEERGRALVKQMVERQCEGRPVHEWPLCDVSGLETSWHSFLTVGQVMTTDLFTVRAHDLVDLAASMMQWEHIRHVPVEDDLGHLVGLVSHRDLLSLVGGEAKERVAVVDIMKTDLITVTPRTPTVDAIRVMRDARVGCLPVVEEGRLLGLVTETDFLDVARRVIEEQLARASEGRTEQD